MSDKDTQPLTGKDLARKPRGFPDKRESLIHAQAKLVETVTGIYRKWGFEALETGAFEYADALGKFLPDDDRPNAGVFAIQDDDEQWMSLRYDLTAPLARFIARQARPLADHSGGMQRALCGAMRSPAPVVSVNSGSATPIRSARPASMGMPR